MAPPNTFLLDWLEPSAGTELDTSMGINNSYIFFEYSVSNFGGDQMNVGSKTGVTGLAVRGSRAWRHRV